MTLYERLYRSIIDPKHTAAHDLLSRYGCALEIPLWLLHETHGEDHHILQMWRQIEQRDDQPAGPTEALTLTPLSFDDRSANALRPATFDQLVGQDRLKGLLRRIVANAQSTGMPLDHMLIVGASGTGKTTVAQIVAHELGRTVYQVKAPVEMGVFDWLARHGCDGDVVIVDEIHLQVKGDRRGVTQAADPESFFHTMEDRRLPTAGGMIAFPSVTFIGATTDSGLLPEAFINRFPLSLTLDPYDWDDMARLAIANAHALGMAISDIAAQKLGRASRRTPRQLNSYIRNALSLVGRYDGVGAGLLTEAVADEVVGVLNGTTWDGLTIDQQRMLKALYRSRRDDRRGNPVYQASVNTIATALGHGRDTKAVSLFVEPYLIQEGLVIVTHGGRQLSDAGVARAQELSA